MSDTLTVDGQRAKAKVQVKHPDAKAVHDEASVWLEIYADPTQGTDGGDNLIGSANVAELFAESAAWIDADSRLPAEPVAVEVGGSRITAFEKVKAVYPSAYTGVGDGQIYVLTCLGENWDEAALHPTVSLRPTPPEVPQAEDNSDFTSTAERRFCAAVIAKDSDPKWVQQAMELFMAALEERGTPYLATVSPAWNDAPVKRPKPITLTDAHGNQVSAHMAITADIFMDAQAQRITTLEAVLGRGILYARSKHPTEGGRSPRWLRVMDTFQIPSKQARELCQQFNLNPDEEVTN